MGAPISTPDAVRTDGGQARRRRVRELVVDANDGIIAVAGIGEGFLGAGASRNTAMLAVVSATIAGSIALGGSKYAEAANERDAQQELIDEEQRQLALSPAAELAELTSYYVGRGISPDLAAQVAAELSGTNPLAAQLDAKHGIDVREPSVTPWLVALTAGVAFATGAALIVLTVAFSAPEWRTQAVLVAAGASLLATSIVAGRWGKVPIWRTALRTVVIGLIALLLSLAIGSMFEL